MRLLLPAFALVVTILPNIRAGEPPVARNTKLKVEARVAFTEGPVWHPSGNVYFSDIDNNRIMRRDRAGQLHVFRTPSGRSNGLLFDHQGRLLACEGGGAGSNRRVTRTELDGTITVMADNYQGKKFNSPNDLTVDSKGRIYFTDPRYRDRTCMEQRDAKGRAIEGVYRIDAPGKVTRIIEHEVDRPNGIAVSPDEKFLFVADNVNDGLNNGVGGNRKLWRFDLKADGNVDRKSRKLLFDWGTDRGPDGMAVDQKGTLYVTAGSNIEILPAETSKKYKSGVYVVSPEGKLLHFIAVPIDMITNCAFGDADRKTLYITAGHKLWSVRTNTPGHLAWPKKTSSLPRKKIDFAHDIVPILQARCAKCHTNGTYKGSVSMDTREALLKSEIVLPGKSAVSELIKRITHTDARRRMPPKEKSLTSKEIALLKQWIDQGVSWEVGFSFKKTKYIVRLKPRRPKLPPAKAGLEHPIDRILSAYFLKHKINPPDLTDDVTFIRRVYLDVIGQLPAPSEVDEFVNDRDGNKRTRLATRILTERRAFTDHWLTFWNDLLRNDYAGTGYIDGGRKQISDWLYRSLLENKPYDQFTRELINPNQDSEGFIRGIKWRGNVNASQVRELQFSQNVSLVFLGLNMKCASCHDSFINKWKLKDAYGLAAVIAERKLEIHRCDKPTGAFAEPKFLWPELGTIDVSEPREKRLEQLANLITHTDNGRFSRTIVNRLWHRLMGRGIVHPVDIMANEPWNEDLLDYLAVYFMDNDYDLKMLIGHVITSRAYQSRAAIFAKEQVAQDYRFRGPQLKRMTAEQFIDAVWQLTGAGPKRPSARVPLPPFDTTAAKERRYIRASLMRSNLLMRSLGRPNREQVVTTRPDVLTTLQALDLSNGQILTNYLNSGADNLLRANPQTTGGKLIETIYRHALCRPPTPEETTAARAIVGEPMTREGVADLLWCVVMLPEFQLVR